MSSKQIEGIHRRGVATIAKGLLVLLPSDPQLRAEELLSGYAKMQWLLAIDSMKGRINPTINPDTAKALDALCDQMLEEYSQVELDVRTQEWREAKQ